jgi:hypothetical protein
MDDENTTIDAVALAAAGNGSEFKAAINDLLMARISDAVELKKTEVANQFLSPQEDDDQENFEGEEHDDQEV